MYDNSLDDISDSSSNDDSTGPDSGKPGVESLQDKIEL
jgi:hypothetical protein